MFKTFVMGLLWPFSLLWEWVYRIRRFAYDYGILTQNEFRVPIISVGNVTFGGTGKTPFTLWLAQYLNAIDKKVLILMRGYRGKLENKSGILRRGVRVRSNPIAYGDEALLLARRLPDASIVVGKNRSENLEYYFSSEMPDVALLDDGHQHLKIKRNLNIVLFDSLLPLSCYKLAPRGYLREGLTALGCADVVVLGRCDQVNADKREALRNLLRPYLRPTTVFAEMCYQVTGLFNSEHSCVCSLNELAGKKVICVAGIASPQSFFSQIRNAQAELIEKISFPDHHYFTKEELCSLLELAKKHDALIITTEKDMVKIKRIVDDARILYMGIDVKFMSGEEEVVKRILKIL